MFEFGDTDEESDVVGVSVSFLDFPTSRGGFTSASSFGKSGVSVLLGLVICKLAKLSWVASGSMAAFSVLLVLFDRIPCCMAILCALGYFLLSSGGGGVISVHNHCHDHCHWFDLCSLHFFFS